MDGPLATGPALVDVVALQKVMQSTVEVVVVVGAGVVGAGVVEGAGDDPDPLALPPGLADAPAEVDGASVDDGDADEDDDCPEFELLPFEFEFELLPLVSRRHALCSSQSRPRSVVSLSTLSRSSSLGSLPPPSETTSSQRSSSPSSRSRSRSLRRAVVLATAPVVDGACELGDGPVPLPPDPPPDVDGGGDDDDCADCDCDAVPLPGC